MLAGEMLSEALKDASPLFGAVVTSCRESSGERKIAFDVVCHHKLTKTACCLVAESLDRAPQGILEMVGLILSQWSFLFHREAMRID